MKSIVKLLPILLIALAPAAFAESVIYNSIPNPLPPNVVSQAYQATQTGEFGGLIQFAGGNTSYSLSSATIAMSDWALASTPANAPNGTTITSTGFYVPLTLSLYNVGPSDAVGSLIGSDSITAFIPFRPEPDGCIGGDSTSYTGSDHGCYHGSLSTVTFDLAGIDAPNQIIYGLSFNTQTYGAAPIGVDGPYNSLNIGLSTTDPSVGSNPLPGTAYLDSGTGIFRQDSGWAPYSGAVEFDAASPTPEPSSLVLLGTGILGLAGAVGRKLRSV
jgi:hypothetical protein